MEVRDKIKLGWELVKANPLLTVLAVALVALLVWFFAGSIKESVLSRKTDHAVDKLESKADEKLIEAHETAGAREAEDAHRQTQIKPKIEQANRDRASARTRTQKAEQDYETSITRPLVDPELNALRDRNCSSYSELYPADYERHCLK